MQRAQNNMQMNAAGGNSGLASASKDTKSNIFGGYEEQQTAPPPPQQQQQQQPSQPASYMMAPEISRASEQKPQMPEYEAQLNQMSDQEIEAQYLQMKAEMEAQNNQQQQPPTQQHTQPPAQTEQAPSHPAALVDSSKANIHNISNVDPYQEQYEREYQEQLKLLQQQESSKSQQHRQMYPEGMGQPGMRNDYQVNPYLQKENQNTIPARGQPTQPSGKGLNKPSSYYDLGGSSIQNGIFSAPAIGGSSQGSRTGKRIAFNPATGTYSNDRPF